MRKEIVQQCLSFCQHHIQSVFQHELGHTVSSQNQTGDFQLLGGQLSGMFGHLSSSKPLIQSQSAVNSSSFGNRMVDIQPIEEKLKVMIQDYQTKFMDECLQPVLAQHFEQIKHTIQYTSNQPRSLSLSSPPQ